MKTTSETTTTTRLLTSNFACATIYSRYDMQLTILSTTSTTTTSATIASTTNTATATTTANFLLLLLAIKLLSGYDAMSELRKRGGIIFLETIKIAAQCRN